MGRILFPRIRYLQQALAQMSSEELANQWEAREIQDTVQRQGLKWHEVPPNIVRLREGAQASDRARELAKQEYGADFDIPSGYTFRRQYERGSIGQILGHEAQLGNAAVIRSMFDHE